MSSTFGILEAAKSGLSVSMQNLKITGHNLANVDTAGYTRQRLETSAKEFNNSSYLLRPLGNDRAGQGVEITKILQIRSSYLDQQYRDLNTSYSASESRTQALTYLEGLYDELDEDSGLTTSIESFYEALNSFASNTSSKENRTNVQQQAIGMTENFNNVYSEMTALWNDQNDSLSTISQKVSSVAEKIATLNDAIASYERTGDVANDLNDERNLLLDELSGYVNISYDYNETNSSMIDVKIGEASLVCGTTANKIEIGTVADRATEIDSLTAKIVQANKDIVADPTNADAYKTQRDGFIAQLSLIVEIDHTPNVDNPNLTDIKFSGVFLVNGQASCSISDAASTNLGAWVSFNRNNLTLDGNRISIEDKTLTGGQLYSYMKMITSDSSSESGIPYYMNQLNSLVQEIATDINAIHTTGFTYPHDGILSKNGVNFFKVPATTTDALGNTLNITAGSFSISDEVLESVYNIAGADNPVDLTTGSTETGNSVVAEALSKTLTNNDYYGSLNSIVGHLAIALDTSESILDTKESLINSVDTQRTSISGVSKDEETTNLIKYQQSYNACARTITTIDEMLDVLINNTGIVGR